MPLIHVAGVSELAFAQLYIIHFISFVHVASLSMMPMFETLKR